MMMPPFSLGLDCRDVRPSALARRWDRERRERFLLDPGILCPVSADTAVLPSLFPDFNTLRDCVEPGVPCVPVEWEWRVLARAWPDLASMADILDVHGIDTPAPDHLLLELVLHPGPGLGEHPLWAGLMSLGNDARIAAAKEGASEGMTRAFIGYDVADSSLTSALMNCGYDASEIGPMRARWAGRLNDRGLIADAAHAQEFLAVSDQRIPEHAPFAIFALHAWS